MHKFLTASVFAASLLVLSCSKNDKTDLPGGNPPVDQGPVETATKKLIPDSVFRAYLKAKVCPSAFDASGKYIDITNPEVANFTGTMKIDSFSCPRPFVWSLKGVEYFTKMSKLIVQHTPVDSLNLAPTMQLDTLRVLNNKDMQYVNVSGCTNMRFIRVVDIPATSLNLSNLPALNYINLVSLGRLNELRTDNDANLQHLMTASLSSLKTVDVSTNTALRRLYLEYSTKLNSLDLTHNPKLKFLTATYCPSLKGVDLSKNDSLYTVSFEGAGVETADFSHNPELFSLVMMWTPVRNLDMKANPKLRLLWLDGCTQLQTVDVRAQKNFDFYFIEHSKYQGMSEDDVYQTYQEGMASPVQTSLYNLASPATRIGLNGATENLYGGLRVPQYLDANGLTLRQVMVSDAIKDNYSLVMARRVFSSMTPALITVYANDGTTVLCNDYDPKNFKCN